MNTPIRKRILCATAFTFLVLLACISFGPTVFAVDYVPLAPIPGTIANSGCVNTDPNSADYKELCGTNLSTYLSGMFKVGIAAAGVLAFLVMVWGGFTYLSTDAITGKEEGKEKIERALGGLVLALASYIILNTINPQLVNLNLDFGLKADPAKDLIAPGDYAAIPNVNGVPLSSDELTNLNRGYDSMMVRKRLEELDAKAQNANLTSAEQTELATLKDAAEIIAEGTNAINTDFRLEKDAKAALDTIGTQRERIQRAQTILDQMQAENDTRIDSMVLNGADQSQIAVVQGRFNKSKELIQRCMGYVQGGIVANSQNFNSYCK